MLLPGAVNQDRPAKYRRDKTRRIHEQGKGAPTDTPNALSLTIAGKPIVPTGVDARCNTRTHLTEIGTDVGFRHIKLPQVWRWGQRTRMTHIESWKLTHVLSNSPHVGT